MSLYANKKQKTTPESAKEALEALLPVLSDEALDFTNRDAVFDACKAKAEELARRTAGCSTRWALPSPASNAPRRRHRPGLHDGPREDPGAGQGRHRKAERLIFWLIWQNGGISLFCPKNRPRACYSICSRRGSQNQNTKYQKVPAGKRDFFYAGIHAGHLRREYRQCGAVVAYAAADAGGGAPGPAAGAALAVGLAGGWAVLYGALLPFGPGWLWVWGRTALRPARPGRHWAAAPRLWGAEFAEHLPALRAGSDRGGPLALAGALSPGGSGRRGRAGVQCVLPLPWGGGRRRGTAALLRGGCPAGRAIGFGLRRFPPEKPGAGTLLPAMACAAALGSLALGPLVLGWPPARRLNISSAARERAGPRWPSVRPRGRRSALWTRNLPRRLPGSPAPRGRQPCWPGPAGGSAGRLRGRLRDRALCVQPPGNAFSALLSAGAGLGVVCFLPRQWLTPAGPEEPPGETPQEERPRLSVAATRLEAVAESLSSLAETVNEVYDAFPRRCENFRWVIDNTHDTLCANCGRRESCWKQEYAATLEGMEALRPFWNSRAIWNQTTCPGSCPGASTRRRSAPRLPAPLRSTAAGKRPMSTPRPSARP